PPVLAPFTYTTLFRPPNEPLHRDPPTAALLPAYNHQCHGYGISAMPAVFAADGDAPANAPGPAWEHAVNHSPVPVPSATAERLYYPGFAVFQASPRVTAPHIDCVFYVLLR